jgi:murein DD-endopeptidase MepM/ murein hydrolase activator NlpD
VVVTIPAFPGGRGAFLFIVWSRDNPVKYTDPDGRDTNPIKSGKSAPGYKVQTKYGEVYNNNAHTGVDITSNAHSIVATQKGKVIFASEHPDGTLKATGTLVIIKYDEDGKYGLYGHLDASSLKVKAGDTIEEGADIGNCYTTGDGKMGVSSGAHLHYGRYEMADNKKMINITM